MKPPHTPDRPPRRASLWFALLGGAIAWTAHLLFAYAIAEFGCVGGLGDMVIGGLTVVAWLLGGLTLVCAGVAAAATLAGRRARRRLGSAGLESAGSSEQMADAGFVMSAIFLFVIVCQGVPIVYYLGSC